MCYDSRHHGGFCFFFYTQYIMQKTSLTLFVRLCDPQLQVNENYSDLTKWTSKILWNLVCCQVLSLTCSKAGIWCANRNWRNYYYGDRKLKGQQFLTRAFFSYVQKIWFDVIGNWYCVCCKHVGNCIIGPYASTYYVWAMLFCMDIDVLLIICLCTISLSVYYLFSFKPWHSDP